MGLEEDYGKPLSEFTDEELMKIAGIVIIPLLKCNLFTIVDEEDFVSLNLARYNWYKFKAGHTIYARTGQSTLLHRLILKPPLGLITDHINGDGLDNTRANLRLANKSQNQANQIKRPGKLSKYKGVTYDRSARTPLKWQAKITKNYKTIHLGRFYTEEEAAIAYNDAATMLFGEFANINLVAKGI